MGGFYFPLCGYEPEAFGGLSVKRFAEAIRAEFQSAFGCWEGGNYCLHTHNYFKTYDFFGLGTPTRTTFSDRDAREDDALLAPSEEKYCFSVPWFKHFDKEWIDTYAAVFKKVALNYEELLEGDEDKIQGGHWHGQENDKLQKKNG